MLSTKVGFHSQGSGTAAKGFNMEGFSKTEKAVCEEGRPGLGWVFIEVEGDQQRSLVRQEGLSVEIPCPCCCLKEAWVDRSPGTQVGPGTSAVTSVG